MSAAATRLRQLLNQPGPVLAPGVYDCISAKIVEASGIPAAFVSGAAVTASVLGYPDVGLQTMTEMLTQIRAMCRSVKIPLIADIDTGYGNALNMTRTIQEYEAAGAGGVFFEDQTIPKRCGHFEGKKLVTVEEMVAKIKAACDARINDDFVLIARTDARAGFGLDHAIERGQIYAEAGADVIYVEALLSEDELAKAARSISVPLQANMSEGGGKTPVLHYERLHELGFKIISYSGLLQRAGAKAMMKTLGVLKEEGSAASLYPDNLLSVIERSKLLGLEDYYQLEEKFYGKIQDSEKSWRGRMATAKAS
jgi:methylisocitrate lyase